MQQSEYELIHYGRISGIHIFFDTVEYRSAHIHRELEILWAVKGSLYVFCEGERHLLAEGDLILLNPSRPHEFQMAEKPCTFLCLQVWQKNFEVFLPSLRGRHFVLVHPGEVLKREELSLLRRQMCRAARAYLSMEEAQVLECLSAVSGILALLYGRIPVRQISDREEGKQRDRNARLERLISYVEENYPERIKLKDFARQEGCSVSFLSHLVKENLNQSFQEYVTTVRFRAACRLIEGGAGRMLDVSEAAGFSDYRYFSRCFQERLGMTPEGYQKSLGRQPVRGEKTHPGDVHSVERFYDRESSLLLLSELEKSLVQT